MVTALSTPASFGAFFQARKPIVIAAVCMTLTGLCPDPALAQVTRDISWDDLLPSTTEALDDPFEKLSEEQLLDLGMVARIRYLLESDKISPDGPDALEEERLVARLSEQGIDVDWILTQRERVAEERRQRSELVDEGIDGQHIRLPGYMLPLDKSEAGLVSEFLLVPWVGACVHTPPPPPNQMVHVRVPEGAEDEGRFVAIWISGTINLEPANYDLYLVDGTRSVNVAYTLIAERIETYSAQQSDILSQVEAPAYNPDHTWWQNLQSRVSFLFTRTMTGIRDRESSGPLWIGLAIAFLYGVIHTLGPGHGKAVVVSYFVGQGGSFGRGIRMGVQIAIFHVLSAILIVWITDFAVRQATGNAPSDYRLVKLISYAAIALIGAGMLRAALRSSRLEHDHSHHHEHDSDHPGQHVHPGCQACATLTDDKGPSAWLALAVGSVPCTGALLVLLFGMAHDLLLPAIFMVIAISAGMALAMSGIGALAILGRNYVDRKMADNEQQQNRFAHGARIAGASLVLLIGLGLFSLTLAWDQRSPFPASEQPSADTALP